MRPPILMIHGMWGTGAVWDRMAGAFRERGRPVHTPTLPHHGPDRDPAALGVTGLDHYRDALLEIVAGLDQPPVLIGHSMGGLLAQMVAATIPVRAVVLLNSAAPAGIQCIRPVMLPGVGRVFCRLGFWRKPFRLTRWEADYCLFNRVPPDQRPHLRAGMVYESGRAALQVALWFLDGAETTRVDPEAISCPMLFFAGARDRITPASVCRAIAKRYGHRMDYRELPGRGHWLPEEPGWQARAAEIEAWLEAVL